MGNIANLRPFQKGQSGNPRGRPKGPSLEKIVRRHLREKAGDGLRHIDAILIAQIKNAEKGDLAAAQWLTDRGYGKMVQPVSDPEGGALGPKRIILEFKLPGRENAEVAGSDTRQIGLETGEE